MPLSLRWWRAILARSSPFPKRYRPRKRRSEGSSQRGESTSGGQLQVGGVYIALFSRGNVPEKDNFQSTFYLHVNDREGYVFGIKAEQDGFWEPGHYKRTSEQMIKEPFLIGLLHIATMVDRNPGVLFNQIDTLMRSQDETLNDQPIIRDTHQWAYVNLAKLFGILPALGNGGDGLQAMMAEIKYFGNSHARSALDGETPRPIEKASFWREVSL